VVNRILAVVAAIAMIGGAIAYRSSRDTGSGGGGSSATQPVVCAAELGAVCDALPGSVIEPAAETADRLLKVRGTRDAGLSGWIAPGPWAEMVDAGRRAQARAALFTTTSTPLARTTLVVVVKPGKLPGACGGTATWKCIGDAAQAPGFFIGADPASSSVGLFSRAALLAGFFGRTTYATNDLPDGQEWLSNLQQRFGEAGAKNATDVQRFLIQAPDVAAFLTTAALAAAGGAHQAQAGPPQPKASIAVVFAPIGKGGLPAERLDAVRRALADAHWQPATGSNAEGLPSPGVLLALREVVS